MYQKLSCSITQVISWRHLFFPLRGRVFVVRTNKLCAKENKAATTCRSLFGGFCLGTEKSRSSVDPELRAPGSGWVPEVLNLCIILYVWDALHCKKNASDFGMLCDALWTRCLIYVLYVDRKCVSVILQTGRKAIWPTTLFTMWFRQSWSLKSEICYGAMEFTGNVGKWVRHIGNGLFAIQSS